MSTSQSFSQLNGGARGQRRSSLLLALIMGVNVQADAQGSATQLQATASVTVRGCVIDADTYSPVSTPVTLVLEGGTPLGVVQSGREGRFSMLVPAVAKVYLMTPSGPRSAHSAAWVNTNGHDVEVPGCLMHFN